MRTRQHTQLVPIVVVVETNGASLVQRHVLLLVEADDRDLLQHRAGQAVPPQALLLPHALHDHEADHYDEAHAHDNRERKNEVCVDVEWQVAVQHQGVWTLVLILIDDDLSGRFADEHGRDIDVVIVVGRHLLCTKSSEIAFRPVNAEERCGAITQVIAANVMHNRCRVAGLLSIPYFHLERAVPAGDNHHPVEIRAVGRRRRRDRRTGVRFVGLNCQSSHSVHRKRCAEAGREIVELFDWLKIGGTVYLLQRSAKLKRKENHTVVVPRT